MPFSFLQRGSLADLARQLTLTSYEPALVLEGLIPGIDKFATMFFSAPNLLKPHDSSSFG